MRRKLTFVDLFCGAGGWTQGLKSAGLRHLGGIDKDAKALKTYIANHGEAGAMVADVAEVDVKDIRASIGPGVVDVVFASPPCQGFSTVGPRRIGDPNDRLSESVPRIASGLGANTVVLENVSGLASKKDASGKLILDGILKMLRKAGFPRIDWRVLKCEMYGVPQRRKRLVMIATKAPNTDPADLFPVPDLNPVVPVMRQLLTPRAQVTGAFYWMDERKRKYYEDRFAEPKTSAFVRFVDLSKVANTMRAYYAKSRGAEALIRYNDGAMRMLTEKECARIQSFPDTYQFVGAQTKVYAQIGNAVPPELARRIGAQFSLKLTR